MERGGRQQSPNEEVEPVFPQEILVVGGDTIEITPCEAHHQQMLHPVAYCELAVQTLRKVYLQPGHFE